MMTRLISPDLDIGSFIASGLSPGFSLVYPWSTPRLPLVHCWSTPGLPLVCRTGFFYLLLAMSLPPHFLLLKTLNCNDCTALHCAAMNCTAICTVLQFTALQYALCCNEVHCSALLYHTALPYFLHS